MWPNHAGVTCSDLEAVSLHEMLHPTYTTCRHGPLLLPRAMLTMFMVELMLGSSKVRTSPCHPSASCPPNGCLYLAAKWIRGDATRCMYSCLLNATPCPRHRSHTCMVWSSNFYRWACPPPPSWTCWPGTAPMPSMMGLFSSLLWDLPYWVTMLLPSSSRRLLLRRKHLQHAQQWSFVAMSLLDHWALGCLIINLVTSGLITWNFQQGIQKNIYLISWPCNKGSSIPCCL